MAEILITGFEPFTTGLGLTLTENPTARWAQEVAARVPACRSATLPVSYEGTKRDLSALFDQYEPTIWLGLGFAPHRTLIDVEYIALNIEDCKGLDNDGCAPQRQAIIPDAPLALTTRFDIDECVAELTDAGLAAQSAFHAGTFLCNQSFYLGCYYVEVLQRIQKAGFIHVPPNVDDIAFVDVLTSILSREVLTLNHD